MTTTSAAFEHAVPLPPALALFAMLVLALATLGSAWSVFQASQWNNRQSDRINASTAARIEAAKQTTIATATLVYDTTLLAQSAAAAADGRPDLQRFYRETLYRPELRTQLDQALARAGGDPTALPNLFASPAYLDGLLGEPRRLDAAAAQFADESSRAGKHADAYTVGAVLLAVTLFFAGASSNFNWLPLRLVLLGIATVTLFLGVARVGGLPIA